MSVDDPAMVYNCKWSWCRLSFSDCNALTHHVIFEHVRRATPVRRRDILMLRRTEEGLGESIKLSDIMHDPSSSLSQKSCPSKGAVQLLITVVHFFSQHTYSFQ